MRITFRISVIAADDRVELLLARKLGQILAVFLQRVIGFLRRFAGHALAAAHGLQRGEERVLA